MKEMEKKKRQCALQLNERGFNKPMTRDFWKFMASKPQCRKALFYGSKKNTDIEGNIETK